MAVLCAAAECRVTEKKERKKKKKESTAVKLKAVSTNVGLPN